MESNKAFAWYAGIMTAIIMATVAFVVYAGYGEVPPVSFWIQDLGLGLATRWYMKCTPSDSADWLLW